MHVLVGILQYLQTDIRIGTRRQGWLGLAWLTLCVAVMDAEGGFHLETPSRYCACRGWQQRKRMETKERKGGGREGRKEERLRHGLCFAIL